MEGIVNIMTACAPIIVALVGIIPTVITNRKKTEKAMTEQNEAMEKRMAKLQATLDAHIREDEDEKARNQRYRILRFHDEVCENREHSESHFEDILDDIDDYEKYCDTHPEFRNNRGRLAMEHIKEVYARAKSNGGFLTHETERRTTAEIQEASA